MSDLNFLNKDFHRMILPLLFAGMIFGFGSLLGPSALALPQPPSSSLGNNGPGTKLSIRLPEGYLCEALDILEQRSGIRFKCPESVSDHAIYETHLQGPNWETIARDFLQDYNTLVIYNSKGQATQMYLLGGGDAEAQNITVSSAPTLSPVPVEPAPAVPGVPGSNLNRSQLFALLKTSIFKPFPQHFFNSSDYEEILKFTGIETPEDWMVPEKSTALKKHIQKLLKK